MLYRVLVNFPSKLCTLASRAGVPVGQSEQRVHTPTARTRHCREHPFGATALLPNSQTIDNKNRRIPVNTVTIVMLAQQQAAPHTRHPRTQPHKRTTPLSTNAANLQALGRDTGLQIVASGGGEVRARKKLMPAD